VSFSQHLRGTRLACAALLCAVTVGAAPGGAAARTSRATAEPAAATGALTGHVTAPAAGGSGTVPAAGVVVTATGPKDTTAHNAVTDANGFYELDDLAPGLWQLSFALAPGGPQQTATVTVTGGSTATGDDTLASPLATVTGTITDRHGRQLPGMVVGLGPADGTSCPPASVCGIAAATGDDGAYTLNVAPGTYELRVLDGSTPVDAGPVTATAGQTTTAGWHLTPASVPAGIAPTHAGRDLRWLNAERTRLGLPAGIVLNPRWAQACAAHDAYERANDVLSQSENPQAPAASVPGAWAGLVSVLAKAAWTRGADPWENAPIHLMQLFTPSLSVVGLDDAGGFQCTTTYPGLLRAPVDRDTVTTYPADGARGVAPREVAREAPFVPGQFVGIPAGRATGRELFVYLNRAGETGQAQVHVVRATLTRGRGKLAVRWVDNGTRTVGRYLTGAILIPVKPLKARTTYRVSVTVQGRTGTLTHSWGFTTRG
jgi:hypothetical protein